MARDGRDLERLLTLGEVAELERVSVRTVRRWIERGALPAVRTGRLLRVRPRDLQTYRLRRLHQC